MLEQVARPLPGAWFAEEVMEAVQSAVGFDGYCIFGVDPVSGLRSVMFSRHGLQVASRRLLHNETVERDVNRYAELAHGPRHAGVLARSGAHEPASPRLHEILRPEGYASELRLALVSGGRYWGALCLFRDDRRHPFTERDMSTANELSEPLSVAIRRYQTGRPGVERQVRPAGVVLVDRDDRMRSTSPAAAAWLAGLAESWEYGANVDDVSRVVLEVARAARAGNGTAPICRSRMPNGEWLVVSGSRVPDGAIDVAVVLRPGDPATVTPAFALWCGLTAKETQVLPLVEAGLAAKQIARRLDLSVLTVNDHLRSIYRKAGVRGREELLSLL